MNIKVILILGIVSGVFPDTPPVYFYGPPEDTYGNSMDSANSKDTSEYGTLQSDENSAEYRPTMYGFSYVVKDDYSGNDFGHEESRNRDFTEGSYYVLLPDGRLQSVKYYVDGNSGYVVEVTYEGEAQYPESHEIRRYGEIKNEYSVQDSDEDSRESVVAEAPSIRYFVPNAHESEDSGESSPGTLRNRYSGPFSDESKEGITVMPSRGRYFSYSSEASTEDVNVVLPGRRYSPYDSNESRETVTVAPPRRRYSPPDSEESSGDISVVPPGRRYLPPDSDESREAVIVIPPRRRYSLPDSEESTDVNVVPPGRRYFSPDSDESRDSVTVATPRRRYSAPDSGESKDAVTLAPPKRHYFVPITESREANTVASPRRTISFPESHESRDGYVYPVPSKLFNYVLENEGAMEISVPMSEISKAKALFPPRLFYARPTSGEDSESSVAPPRRLYSAP
ncbi:hypothetical protein SK128_016688 [Halocaridina rubra]|uniref:Pro-resilin n=1 Tax=Halocaridina rubra TaxID=373956 RepID=A0AAN8X9F3_HALRR